MPVTITAYLVQSSGALSTGCLIFAPQIPMKEVHQEIYEFFQFYISCLELNYLLDWISSHGSFSYFSEFLQNFKCIVFQKVSPIDVITFLKT
jgi:hypothetical protein